MSVSSIAFWREVIFMVRLMLEAVESESQPIESTSSRLPEVIKKLVAFSLGMMILYTGIAGAFDSLVQRSVMLASVILLAFMVYPPSIKGRFLFLGRAIDGLLCVFAIAACLYVAWNQNRILTQLPIAGVVDITLCVFLVITVLEICRRSVGIAFPLMVLLSLAYVFFGDRLSGDFGHRGYGVELVVETLFLSDLGLWGMLTGIGATVIASFVLFGAVLIRTGGSKVFMDLAMIFAANRVGGAAKMATVASAAFGSVNGSAVANVATTGAMTIPLMKRMGYPAPIAGAVEAVASTGGQLTPPILGAAAFIMAETLGISYLSVALAALIPALMFYSSVFMTIHLIALRKGIGGLTEENDVPKIRDAIKLSKSAPLLVGLGVLVVMVLSGRSVAFSASLSIVGMLITYTVAVIVRGEGIKLVLNTFVDSCVDAGYGILIIITMLVSAQIVVAMINMTGVGVTISSLAVGLGGGYLFGVAFIVALACLLLGMGIPTTAAYVLVAAVMAPALVSAGVEPIAAHMFVFYFATISVITPPLCVAVFVASSIADTRWERTALQAVRLAAVTYMIPFLFITYPGVLFNGDVSQILEAVLSGAVLVVSASIVLSDIFEKDMKRKIGALLCIVSASMAIIPSLYALFAGAVVLLFVLAFVKPFSRNAATLN